MAVETAEQKEREVWNGLAKLGKPYAYLTAYYLAIAAAIAAMLLIQPRLIQLMPVGGAADFGAVGQAAFEPVEAAQAAQPARSTLADSVRLALAIIGSFLLMLPVTWICMGARRRKDVSQSFIQTILVLPVIITGIVHVVHNSLALAFSLAGIVAGVRFRHTLKDSAETTYLFTAIAVGVACGINAVEVAAIISIFFNYTVLGLWAMEYGAATTGKQMFSRQWMAKDDEPKRSESRQARDEDDDD
ncbi:MAG TPA: DUF4956 domain-containing protein [Vitreimonas sp.]|uniref:DUF4956 domain-containing protein n=1 Tax=Vitreimonas sp. TaxID=3069702 RepID=UPI002D614254|nr:DUF4956 domain-containing protein [Vitreimonas sp.]HYD86858.1 DUF4956 domain-containing protein [Vitreimonas sp.]